MGDIERFDDIVRSERYFTAMLLPAILLAGFGGEYEGIKEFLALVASRRSKARHATDTDMCR